MKGGRNGRKSCIHICQKHAIERFQLRTLGARTGSWFRQDFLGTSMFGMLTAAAKDKVHPAANQLLGAVTRNTMKDQLRLMMQE